MATPDKGVELTNTDSPKKDETKKDGPGHTPGSPSGSPISYIEKKADEGVVLNLTPEIQIPIAAAIAKEFKKLDDHTRNETPEARSYKPPVLGVITVLLIHIPGVVMAAFGLGCLITGSDDGVGTGEICGLEGGISLFTLGGFVCTVTAFVLGTLLRNTRWMRYFWNIFGAIWLFITYGMLFGGGAGLVLYYLSNVPLSIAEVYFQVAVYPIVVTVVVLAVVYGYIKYSGKPTIQYIVMTDDMWRKYRVTYYILAVCMIFGAIMISFAPLMPCFVRMVNGSSCFGNDPDGPNRQTRFIIASNYVVATLFSWVLLTAWLFWLDHFSRLNVQAMSIRITPPLTGAKMDVWCKEASEFLKTVNSSFNELMALFITLLLTAGLASILAALSSLTRFRIVNTGAWLQFVIFTCGADLGCLAMLWTCTGLESELSAEVGRIGAMAASMSGEGGHYDEVAYLTMRNQQWASRYKGVSFLGFDLSAGQLKGYILLLITQPVLALVQSAWDFAIANFGI